MKKIALILFFAFFCSHAAAEPLLLRLKVTKIEFTKHCSNCENNPMPWSYWHIYTGKIIQVIDGKYSKKTIRFGLLQHAKYELRYVKDVYVVVEHADKDTETKLGVEYLTDHISMPHAVVCISPEAIEKLSDRERYEDSLMTGSKSCYYREKLDAPRNEDE